MTYLRSVLFLLWFAIGTLLLAVPLLFALVLGDRPVERMAKRWSKTALLGLRICARTSFEIRGEIPDGPSLVASKHMSMWDTLALHVLVKDPAFVLKRELLRVPIYGWYLRSLGMIAIDRQGGSPALRVMSAKAQDAFAKGRTVIIFPEGTRKQPRSATSYRPGVASLYLQLNAPCIPVALNSGLFWTGPMGLIKRRGRIVLQFLPAIEPGLNRRAFMEELEKRIEDATRRLIDEGNLSATIVAAR